LSDTVSVELPDAQIQQAYDWSRVSMLQGIVNNPFLGTGLVAGYRSSGESQRPDLPGSCGRRSLWTSPRLMQRGFRDRRARALQFISKYQREDGKMPHEIAPGCKLRSRGSRFPTATLPLTPLPSTSSP